MKRKLFGFMLVIAMILPMCLGLTANAYISDADYTVAVGDEIIPFSDYPAGSYFTDNGKACTDHKVSCGAGASYVNEMACNCKCTWEGISLNSTSCYGFANMVFYRLFGHTTYCDTKKVVSDIPANDISKEYLYELFTNGTVKAGAHIRNSTHSMIFMGCDTEYIYTYEGNFDGHCQVGVIKRSWDEMVRYLKNKNGIKFIDMPVSYPETVLVGRPTEGWICKTKEMVAVGEEIAFNYNAKGAKVFYLGIDKAGEGRIQTVYTGDSDWYQMSLSEPGTYTVYASCYNLFGHTDTFKETFTVYDTKPQNVNLSVEVNDESAEKEVLFNFSADNAVEYMIAINNEETGIVDVETIAGEENYTVKFDEAGKFSACVTAVNNYGSCSSDQVKFTVRNVKPAHETAENLMSILKAAIS